jgi:UDP-glucose 4-epimerase
MPKDNPVSEEAELKPMSPYGSSKMMTEIMLTDTARAHDFRYVALRYFNVAGADPKERSGQSTPNATHLIKVACEVALGKRPYLEVFGTDYETPDGTCIRDYIQVTDLARAHLAALRHLRDDGPSDVFNCGYSKGFSVLEVIEAVKRVSGADFEVRLSARRPGDPAAIVAASDKIRVRLGWRPAYDHLDTIARQALAWETHLKRYQRAS